MGIINALNPLLTELAKGARLSGAVCTQGVMTLEDGDDPHEYFSGLGFSSLEAMDIFDYEGAITFSI